MKIRPVRTISRKPLSRVVGLIPCGSLASWMAKAAFPCLCIRIHSLHRHGGWQIQPVFHVYQHRDHGDVLDELRSFFGCGTVRSKGSKSDVLTYSVSSLSLLLCVIVPFFEEHELRVKAGDFRAFAAIVRAMRNREHLTEVGFEKVVRLAFGMNANGKQRSRSLEDVLAGSSETARQACEEASALSR